MQDKILLGLVVLGVLAILFFGLWGPSGSDDSHSKTAQQAAVPAGATAHAPAATPQSQRPAQPGLDPNEATEFIKWWMQSAMDYQAGSCLKNHENAFLWMTPDAAAMFKGCFWTPEVSSAIASGQWVAAFQPVSVAAKAVNPDGSLVMGMTGTLVFQQTGQAPITQQIVTDLLLKKDKGNMRICGMYNYPQAATQQVSAPAVSAAPVPPTYSPSVY